MAAGAAAPVPMGDRVRLAVEKLAQTSDAGDLISVTEEAELSPPKSTSDAILSNWTTLQILAYIHAGDLMSAKFLCKRIPAGKIEKYPSIAAASEAARQLAFRQPGPFFATMQSATWGGSLRVVADLVVNAVQQRSAALLKAAYSNISTKAAASKLGLSEADTCTLLQAQGWKLDSRSGMLSAEGGAGTTSAAPEADIDTVTQALEGLLSSAVALEQPPVQAALLG